MAGSVQGQYLDEAIETMPRERLTELQEGRLLDLLPLLYERSGLVNETWTDAKVLPTDIASLDEFFEKAPFMEKATLHDYRDSHDDVYSGLRIAGNDPWGITTTSGTSGDPVTLPLYGRSDSVLIPGIYRESYTRGFWGMGARPGEYLGMVHFTFRGPVFGAVNHIGAVPILFDHNPGEMARLCRMVTELRPPVVYLLSAGLVLALEDLERTTGLDVAAAFAGSAVVWGGEAIGKHSKAAFDRWGVDLYENNNIGDVTVGFDCSAHLGCHVPEDQALIEFLRPGSDERAATGERAEMVVTTLDPTMPLVRYRSEDLVEFHQEPCECGRTHVRIKTVGRTSDEIKVGATSVMPADIWPAIESVPETEAALFQVIAPHRELDVLRLRVGYDPEGARPAGEVHDAVRDTVAAAVGVEPEVELVLNADLLKLGPPHKIPRTAKA